MFIWQFGLRRMHNIQKNNVINTCTVWGSNAIRSIEQYYQPTVFLLGNTSIRKMYPRHHYEYTRIIFLSFFSGSDYDYVYGNILCLFMHIYVVYVYSRSRHINRIIRVYPHTRGILLNVFVSVKGKHMKWVFTWNS